MDEKSPTAARIATNLSDGFFALFGEDCGADAKTVGGPHEDPAHWTLTLPGGQCFRIDVREDVPPPRRRRLDHSSFANLSRSERDEILRDVVSDFPRSAVLVLFYTGVDFRTYAVLQLNGMVEFATFLVAFGEGVHLENGRYGFLDQRAATDDVYRRAGV